MASTKKRRSNEASQNVTTSCGSCDKTVQDDNDAILCEICDLWHHIECKGLSKEAYNFLSKQHNSIHWYCRKCDVAFAKMCEAISRLELRQEKIEQKVEELDSRTKDTEAAIKYSNASIHKIEEKVKELEVKVDCQNIERSKIEGAASGLPKAEVEKIIKVELKSSEEERREREHRRQNIMIFELKELEESSRDISLSNDTSSFKQVCVEVLEVDIKPQDIIQVTRIGKKAEGNTRPLRIKLSSEEKKKEIFMNLHKLRASDSKKIHFDHDLTKLQRQERKELIEKAKKMTDEDQSKKYKYLVKGPPWSMFIKRVPRIQEEIPVKEKI